MKTEMNTRRSCRGISIVEVVIALVIISIISASALSMVLLSVDIEANAVITIEVANSAENVVECFRFSDTAEVFLEALKKTAPYEAAGDGSFVLDANGYTVTIFADFAALNLTYTAVNTDGEEIYSFVYAKTAADAPGAAQPGEGGAAE